MKIYVITFFPDIFKTYFNNTAPFKKAFAKCLIEIEYLNIRDYTLDKHKRTDGYPYGGGAGLVLFCQPVVDAIRSIKEKSRVIITSPDGKRFDHNYALNLSKEKSLIIIAGRYEGYDQRIFDSIEHEKISTGDYILTGGEISGLSIIDATCRQIKGVLDNEDSLNEESFTNGLLEYPHYTRPYNYKGLLVPDVLISGHHEKINKERNKWSLINTYINRPDLLKKLSLNEKEIHILKEYIKEKHSEH